MRKKIIRYFSAMVLLLALLLSLTSCGSARIENIIVEFWMSNDGGVTWTQRTFEQPAFQSICLKVRVRVSANRNRASTHAVTLRIDDSEHITSRVIGGPYVNPRSTVSAQFYDFIVRGVRDNEYFTELYVEFMSRGEGTKHMHLEFIDLDTNVYDRIHTLNIVGSRTSPGER